MTEHAHAWERQPTQCGRTFDRYRCGACGVWGYRVVGVGRRLGPVVAYVKGWTPPPVPTVHARDEDELGGGRVLPKGGIS